MKRRVMPQMKEASVNVTPLIDVVMVLIIFFMLVAKIGVSRGADEDIALPSAIFGKNIESLSNTLTLNLHENKHASEPTVYAMIEGQKRQIYVTAKTAAGNTDYQLARVLKAFHDQFQDKATIIIRGDQDMPYRQLELVLLACSQAGIPNVTYETKPGTDTAVQSSVALAH